MPVTTTTNKTSYACDASQTIFPFSFPIFAQTELVVVIRDSDGEDTTLTITTDYTVAQSGDSWDSGGNVTTVATWGAGNTIVIKRVVAETQETDYVENDAFAAETHENVVDKLTMIAQQIVEKLSRTVLLGEGTPKADLTLPEPVAEKYLAWMADLSGLKNVSALVAGALTVSEFVETILDDADAAAVIATLGLDADLATLSLPASTTISAFIKTLLDDATATTARTTLDAEQIGVIQNAVAFVAAQTRYFECVMIGAVSAAELVMQASRAYFNTAADGVYGYIAVNLPNGATIIQLKSHWTHTGGQCDVELWRSSITGAGDGELAGTSHTSTGLETDASIDNAVVDNASYNYYAKLVCTGETTGYLNSVGVVYTITEPKP